MHSVRAFVIVFLAEWDVPCSKSFHSIILALLPPIRWCGVLWPFVPRSRMSFLSIHSMVTISPISLSSFTQFCQINFKSDLYAALMIEPPPQAFPATG